MRKGIVKISAELLVSGLQFPVGWEIEHIHMREGDRVATVIISGAEFPEVQEGSDPKECKIIVHKEHIRFEIEEMTK